MDRRIVESIVQFRTLFHKNSFGLRRFISGTFVIALHVLLIALLLRAVIAPRGESVHASVLWTALIESPRNPARPSEPPPDPQLQPADVASDPAEPQFEIDSQPVPAAREGVAETIPPRPDPERQNPSPQLPREFASHPCQVTLSVLVDSLGGVSDARVAQSCGEARLDALALSFARTNWHFRPALRSGHAVADWTTVFVRFLP